MVTSIDPELESSRRVRLRDQRVQSGQGKRWQWPRLRTECIFVANSAVSGEHKVDYSMRKVKALNNSTKEQNIWIGRRQELQPALGRGAFVGIYLLALQRRQVPLSSFRSHTYDGIVWTSNWRCSKRSRSSWLAHKAAGLCPGRRGVHYLCQSAAFDGHQTPNEESHRPHRSSADGNQLPSRNDTRHPRARSPTDHEFGERMPDTTHTRHRDGIVSETTAPRSDGKGIEPADGPHDDERAMIGDGFPERKPIIDAQPQQTRAADDGRAIDSRTADADESSKLPAHRSATDPEANSATVPASSSTRESPLRRFTTLVSDLASHALDRAFGPGTASNLWDSLNHDPTQIHAQLADPNAAYEIEFENVYKSFESRPVLKGLNLRIRRGEAVGIMGRSGCGKSTTLRLIAGFELPDAGSVRIRGWTRDEPIQYELGPIKIGMVFQHAALFDSLTVFENVAFELEHNTDLTDVEIEQAVDVILTRLGLGDTRELLPSQLSGGMRKRVSLARSLVSDLGKGSKPLPDLLLYDEPTAGLDPIASTRIENLIREVRETVPTCIVVSHQLSTIQRTVDRVVLLHGGRIRWDGPVTELEQTRNPFVRQLLSGDEKGPMSGPEFDPDSTLYTPDDLDEALE